MTCQYIVPNSMTSNCNGRYIHSGISIKTTCKPNYYLKGPAVAKCKDVTRSQCLPCSCNRDGSKSAECTNQTGKCSCGIKVKAFYTKPYYGDKCTNLDCAWTRWGGYSR